MIVTAKVVAIFFGLATTAFCVSTIVLAVQNSNLDDDLQEARNKIEMLTTKTTTTIWATTTSIGTTSTSKTDTTQVPTSTFTSTAATTPTQPVNPNETTATTSSTNTSTTEFPYPTITIPTTTTTLAPGFKDPEVIAYRLPTDLRPIKYRLHFHPNLQTHTSENTVSVQVEVENVTNLIVMHAKNLEIDGISIHNMMLRTRISINRYYMNEELELFIIELNELLRTATPYVVSISYRNNLDGLSGIYVGSYHDGISDKK